MTPIENIFDTDFDFIIKQSQTGRKMADKPPLHIPKSFESTEDFKKTSQSQPQQPTSQSEEQKQEKSIPNEFVVAQVFYPLILVSKYAGFCPVKITRKIDGNESPTILYSFKWLSLQFWGTFLWGILLGMLLVVWIINVIFRIPWPFQL